VTPTVHYARPVLAAYGWKVLEKRLPVELEDIENKVYANNVKDSGCCGADEFLKLWAYTLTDYHRVVHLDMDSIVFKNMVRMFGSCYKSHRLNCRSVAGRVVFNRQGVAVYWRLEYAWEESCPASARYVGLSRVRMESPVMLAHIFVNSGGFLVIKPSMERFEEFRAVIRKGDHTGQGGWGGSHIGSHFMEFEISVCDDDCVVSLLGNFWGGQTIQGILPYFYYSIHPGEALEVNRYLD
jgi:hypothetical protein